jgi:hypothetical protein
VVPADPQTYKARSNPQERASKNYTKSWEGKKEIKLTACSCTSAWDSGRRTEIKLITELKW